MSEFGAGKLKFAVDSDMTDYQGEFKNNMMDGKGAHSKSNLQPIETIQAVAMNSLWHSFIFTTALSSGFGTCACADLYFCSLVTLLLLWQQRIIICTNMLLGDPQIYCTFT
jgi:hypothetical protein